MEFIINKIISIDKDAEVYRQGTEEILKEKETELERSIDKIKDDWLREEKEIKNEIIKEKISKAEEKAKAIAEEKENQLEVIKIKYSQNHESIVNEVFRKIINSL